MEQHDKSQLESTRGNNEHPYGQNQPRPPYSFGKTSNNSSTQSADVQRPSSTSSDNNYYSDREIGKPRTYPKKQQQSHSYLFQEGRNNQSAGCSRTTDDDTLRVAAERNSLPSSDQELLSRNVLYRSNGTNQSTDIAAKDAASPMRRHQQKRRQQHLSNQQNVFQGEENRPRDIYNVLDSDPKQVQQREGKTNNLRDWRSSSDKNGSKIPPARPDHAPRKVKAGRPSTAPSYKDNLKPAAAVEASRKNTGHSSVDPWRIQNTGSSGNSSGDGELTALVPANDPRYPHHQHRKIQKKLNGDNNEGEDSSNNGGVSQQTRALLLGYTMVFLHAVCMTASSASVQALRNRVPHFQLVLMRFLTLAVVASGVLLLRRESPRFVADRKSTLLLVVAAVINTTTFTLYYASSYFISLGPIAGLYRATTLIVSIALARCLLKDGLDGVKMLALTASIIGMVLIVFPAIINAEVQAVRLADNGKLMQAKLARTDKLSYDAKQLLLDDPPDALLPATVKPPSIHRQAEMVHRGVSTFNGVHSAQSHSSVTRRTDPPVPAVPAPASEGGGLFRWQTDPDVGHNVDEAMDDESVENYYSQQASNTAGTDNIAPTARPLKSHQNGDNHNDNNNYDNNNNNNSNNNKNNDNNIDNNNSNNNNNKNNIDYTNNNKHNNNNNTTQNFTSENDIAGKYKIDTSASLMPLVPPSLKVLGYLLILIAGVFNSSELILLSGYLRVISPTVQAFWFGVFGTLISAAIMILTETPALPSNSNDMILFILHGIGAAMSIFSFIVALKYLTASSAAITQSVHIVLMYIAQWTVMNRWNARFLSFVNMSQLAGTLFIIVGVLSLPVTDILHYHHRKKYGPML